MTSWIWTIAIILVIMAVFFLIVMIIDGNRFVTVNYELKNEKIKRNHRFVVISDLHNKSYGENNEKLLKKIEELQPEAILIAGDILTAVPGKEYNIALSFVEQLSKKYPLYYGMGNHETRLFLYPETYGTMGQDYERDLQKIKVEFLRNAGKDIEDNIRITGAEIERKYYKRFKNTPMERTYLENILGKPDNKKYQILLAHNPDYFEEYATWGADLVLSGHVHGGIMRLPVLGGVLAPSLRIFPKYDGGLFRSGKSVMILSRGLGSHTIPVRIFNPGELVCVDLKPL